MNKALCSVWNHTLHLYLIKRKYESEKIIVSTDRSSGLSNVDKQTAPRITTKEYFLTFKSQNNVKEVFESFDTILLIELSGNIVSYVLVAS